MQLTADELAIVLIWYSDNINDLKKRIENVRDNSAYFDFDLRDEQINRIQSEIDKIQSRIDELEGIFHKLYKM